MLKLCGDSIWKLLENIFENCFKESILPDEWKSQYCTNSQENDKQLLSNYRPVSLLPICSKIFGCLIYNSMYKHISDNDLLSSNQSGFAQETRKSAFVSYLRYLSLF